MSIIHFVDTNIIFDMNDVCFMRRVRKHDTEVYEIEVKFKTGGDPIIVFSGSEDECNQKIKRVAETSETSTEPSAIQWVYGTYYQVLYNLQNVDWLSLGSGVDPDSWHVEAQFSNDKDNCYPLNYTSHDDAVYQLEIIARGLASGERVIRIDEISDEETTEGDGDARTS